MNKVCQNCGLSVERTDNTTPGPYSLLCTNTGTYRRPNDHCPGFWNKNEMKDFLDETIQAVKD